MDASPVTDRGGRGDPAASVAQLVGHLDALRLRVAAIIEARRAEDPGLDDPFLGLYLTDDTVQLLLDAPRALPSVPEADERRATADAAPGSASTRLATMAGAFGLDPTDVDLLVVALAPDVDDRFERFYGYLNDDVSRRRASVGLALQLAGASPVRSGDRARLRAGAPLVEHGLVDIEDPDRPFLTRGLRVPDRVTAHLLGDDALDPELVDLAVDTPLVVLPSTEAVARALTGGVSLIHLRERRAGGGLETAASGVDLAGRTSLVLDLERTAPGDRLDGVIATATREAMLSGRILVCGPIDVLLDDDPRASRAGELRRLAEAGCARILVGESAWDPAWSRQVPLQLETDVLGDDQRRAVWAGAAGTDDGAAAADATSGFQLSPRAIVRAADAARILAGQNGGLVTAEHLRAGSVHQNSARLEKLSRRIEPTVGWDDLVLPGHIGRQLHELADRARHRITVIEQWGMRPGGGRGRGVTALFAGDSGTGKTMSAEVIAGGLGLDLYVVNLATVVDKYVGETEKNLDRIFTDAAGVNGVLLFDEADALFGQRSEVKDSHDRYANLEIAYLLQRMESFDGLAVLSTNLRSNLDDAFARRLDAIIEFPLPDEDLRRTLWEHALANLTVADDVDLDFCADRFELSGGNVRSVAITAAYRAAATGRDVDMTCLVRAIAGEYRKLGRLCLEAEFGPYTSIANDRSSDHARP